MAVDGVAVDEEAAAEVDICTQTHRETDRIVRNRNRTDMLRASLCLGSTLVLSRQTLLSLKMLAKPRDGSFELR